MATSVTPATLTLTLTGALTLDGEDKGFSITHTIASVSEMRSVILDVPFASELPIMDRTAAGTVGSITGCSVMLLQNLDDTNECRIRIDTSGADTFDKKLDPNEWMIFFNEEFEVNATEAAFGAYVNFDEVKAQFAVANSQIKVIIYNV